MSYETEILEIFGLENLAVRKLELTFEPHRNIKVEADIIVGDIHGEKLGKLLKKYKVEEIKDDL